MANLYELRKARVDIVLYAGNEETELLRAIHGQRPCSGGRGFRLIIRHAGAVAVHHMLRAPDGRVFVRYSEVTRPGLTLDEVLAQIRAEVPAPATRRSVWDRVSDPGLYDETSAAHRPARPPKPLTLKELDAYPLCAAAELEAFRRWDPFGTDIELMRHGTQR